MIHVVVLFLEKRRILSQSNQTCVPPDWNSTKTFKPLTCRLGGLVAWGRLISMIRPGSKRRECLPIVYTGRYLKGTPPVKSSWRATSSVGSHGRGPCKTHELQRQPWRLNFGAEGTFGHRKYRKQLRHNPFLLYKPNHLSLLL